MFPLDGVPRGTTPSDDLDRAGSCHPAQILEALFNRDSTSKIINEVGTRFDGHEIHGLQVSLEKPDPLGRSGPFYGPLTFNHSLRNILVADELGFGMVPGHDEAHPAIACPEVDDPGARLKPESIEDPADFQIRSEECLDRESDPKVLVQQG